VLYAATATRPDIAYVVGAVSSSTVALLKLILLLQSKYFATLRAQLILVSCLQTVAYVPILMLIGLEIPKVATPQQAISL